MRIILNTEDIIDYERIKISMTHDTGLYDCAIILTNNGNTATNQTLGFMVAEESGTYTVSLQYNIEANMEISIQIKKYDKNTKEPIQGILFTVYITTTKQYIKADGTLTTNETKIETDENGEINITCSDLTIGSYTIRVTEVGSNNNYYLYTDQKSTKSISSDGKLTYTFYNNPITINIVKKDANGSSDTSDDDDDYAINEFNSQFLSYGGSGISYDDLLTLLNKIVENNNSSSGHIIYVKNSASSTSYSKLTTVPSITDDGSTYTIAFTTNSSTGYIYRMTYTKESSSTDTDDDDTSEEEIENVEIDGISDYLNTQLSASDLETLLENIISFNETAASSKIIEVNSNTIESVPSIDTRYKYLAIAYYNSGGNIYNIVYYIAQNIVYNSIDYESAMDYMQELGSRKYVRHEVFRV